MPTPPVDRVRPYKAESAATGGTAGDDRPYPRALDPQRDGLDAAGLFMQQVGSADRNVAVWREGHLMHFRDQSMPAGTSVTLSQLAAGGGGGTPDPASPWVNLMSIQPRQSSRMYGVLKEYGIVELEDDDFSGEHPYRVFASVAGLTHVRFSVVVLEMKGEKGRIWIEGSDDDGFTWSKLAPSIGAEPGVDIFPSGGLGPDQNLYRSPVVPFEIADPAYGGTAETLWLRVMIDGAGFEEGIRLGAIRVEGMAEQGPA